MQAVKWKVVFTGCIQILEESRGILNSDFSGLESREKSTKRLPYF